MALPAFQIIAEESVAPATPARVLPSRYQVGLMTVLGAIFLVALAPKLDNDLLLILAFTHLALSQSRNVAVWSIVISPLLALYLQTAIVAHSRPSSAVGTKRAFRPRTERILNITMLLLAGTLYLFETFHFVNAAALRRNEVNTYPAGAVGYMQTHHLPPPARSRLTPGVAISSGKPTHTTVTSSTAGPTPCSIPSFSAPI